MTSPDDLLGDRGCVGRKGANGSVLAISSALTWTVSRAEVEGYGSSVCDRSDFLRSYGSEEKRDRGGRPLGMMYQAGEVR